MKHAHTCLSVASAGLVLAGSQPHAESATIATPALTTEIVGRDVDVLFDPIDSVKDLVSISNGSVYTDEGGSMTISAILDNNSVVELFAASDLWAYGIFNNVDLATITGNNFTDLPTDSVVKGIRFTLVPYFSFIDPRVTLPVGTTFTFAVPESSAPLLTMLGLTFLGSRRSRSKA